MLIRDSSTHEPKPAFLSRLKLIAAAVIGSALLSGATNAQIGQRTGAIPGFPQFYQSFVARQCPGEGSCGIEFGRVPANHLLEATDIYCRGAHSTRSSETGDSADFSLFERIESAVPATRAVFTQPVDDPTETAFSTYTFNRPVRVFFLAGSRPIVVFHSGHFVECRLSGNLVREG
jgi:hypothetical protein